jgi:hypothetical protein
MKRTSLCAIALFVLAVQSAAQSYSIATDIQDNGGLLQYNFTLNYDRLGEENPLTDPIWGWTFNIPTDFGEPTNVVSPEGWTFYFDPNLGDCMWYTEGPDGWMSGDFGSHTIQPGSSLGGFSLSTPLLPAFGLVTATDASFNEDYAVANLPAVVDPVPEPTTLVGFGVLAGLAALRRRGSRKAE